MSVVQYNFPTRIQYGAGAIALLPTALKEAGIKRPLVVTDRALAKLPPIAKVEKLLRDSGIEAATFSDIWGNPLVSHVTQGVLAYNKHKADGIVGIGGGAALDVAKVIALMASHPGELMEYEAFNPKARPIDKTVPPIITVPTTAGTGSEVGRSAVVSDDTSHAKKMFFSPRFLAQRVFLDPELTVGLPAAVTAATGMDALTHCVESYIAKGFHPMCDGIAIEGLRICATELPKAVAFAKRAEGGDKAVLTDPAHVEARGMMLNAAMMGAVAFQKDLGVTHSCAHALSTVCDLHHGLANGIMLPYAMDFYRSVVADKFAYMAKVVGAPDFIKWIESMKNDVGIPQKLSEVGVRKEHLAKLVEFAFADSCHQFGPRKVEVNDLRALFEKAL